MKSLKTWKGRFVRFSRISIFKTLYMNFRCLPLRQAVMFPILIGHGTILRSLKGNMVIKSANLKFGMISFGINQIFNSCNSYKTIIENDGVIVFKGTATFQSGIVLKTFKTGKIEFGLKFSLGRLSQIISKSNILFGDYDRCSWNVYISDTDFHYIKNLETGEVKNNTKRISIGSNCWIANNVSISKGSIIPNNSIVASNSYVNKVFYESNTLLAGAPASIKRRNYIQVFNAMEEFRWNKFYNWEKERPW